MPPPTPTRSTGSSSPGASADPDRARAPRVYRGVAALTDRLGPERMTRVNDRVLRRLYPAERIDPVIAGGYYFAPTAAAWREVMAHCRPSMLRARALPGAAAQRAVRPAPARRPGLPARLPAARASRSSAGRATSPASTSRRPSPRPLLRFARRVVDSAPARLIGDNRVRDRRDDRRGREAAPRRRRVPCCPRCASAATSSSRRSCSRRWPASRTGPSAGCAASTATRARAIGGASGATSLYVSEMITSRALVERTPETMRLIEHDPDENPRSIQLYSVDPATARAAARMLVTEDRADHIDLNFGCPVPKVTRKGGGSALPWKKDLFRAIVGAVVEEGARRDIPVTVKMRKGIDDDHLTYPRRRPRPPRRRASPRWRCTARTAAQAYSGTADWTRHPAAQGDRHRASRSSATATSGRPRTPCAWSRETGCDGVVVGRGCLGRPVAVHRPRGGLRRHLGAGDARRLGEVADTLRTARGIPGATSTARRSARCRDIRKHIAWYLKGFPAGSTIRNSLALVDSLAALDALLATLDPDAPWPGEAAEGQRGRAGSSRTVALPERWLESRELSEEHRRTIAEAELSVSGG